MIRHIGRRGYVKAGKSDDMVKVEVVDVLKDTADKWQLRVRPLSGFGTSVIYPKQLRRLV